MPFSCSLFLSIQHVFEATDIFQQSIRKPAGPILTAVGGLQNSRLLALCPKNCRLKILAEKIVIESSDAGLLEVVKDKLNTMILIAEGTRKKLILTCTDTEFYQNSRLLNFSVVYIQLTFSGLVPFHIFMQSSCFFNTFLFLFKKVFFLKFIFSIWILQSLLFFTFVFTIFAFLGIALLEVLRPFISNWQRSTFSLYERHTAFVGPFLFLEAYSKGAASGPPTTSRTEEKEKKQKKLIKKRKKRLQTLEELIQTRRGRALSYLGNFFFFLLWKQEFCALNFLVKVKVPNDSWVDVWM